MILGLRTRFLVAMGLPVLACTKDKPTSDPSDTATSSTATATATDTATVSATASPSATATASADAGALLGIVGPRSGGGGCGFVIACESAPATAPAAKDAAPKPYDACKASIASALQGSDPHREGIFDADQTKDRRPQNPKICCYKAPRAFCGGGRPLRSEDGLAVVAEAIARTDWATCDLDAPATPDRALADRFAMDAAAEHASVASFARASLQLLALGAPPDLVADVHRAALDEIEHAKICYALAHRRGGPLAGPGPLAVDRAPFETTLASFVTDAFQDGCVGETIAAIDVRSRAASAEGDAVERRALERIADDEERHAELAWRMLAWAVRRGDPEAARVLRAQIDALLACEKDDMVIRTVVVPCAEALLA